MDLTKIELIKNSSLTDLKNNVYLEQLMCKLGFNNEILSEQPQIVKDNCGGLLIWQYPNQFSKYLLLLQTLNIKSYIEIGCRWGGTFVLTTEYLKMFNNISRSVAVDLIDSPVEEYTKREGLEFMKINSQSIEFKDFMKNNTFDLIFIDGDHSYNGVKMDFETSKNSSSIFVFHDIHSDACPGVVQFWKEIKNDPLFEFHEFIEQYFTDKRYLGIGVAIRKT